MRRSSRRMLPPRQGLLGRRWRRPRRHPAVRPPRLLLLRAARPPLRDRDHGVGRRDGPRRGLHRAAAQGPGPAVAHPERTGANQAAVPATAAFLGHPEVVLPLVFAHPAPAVSPSTSSPGCPRGNRKRKEVSRLEYLGTLSSCVHTVRT